jgi:hypothetical protein
MRVSQHAWSQHGGWTNVTGAASPSAQLVFYFAGPQAWPAARPHEHLRALYPDAHIVGCTTGGEILGEDVTDHSVAATALHFDATPIRVATAEVSAGEHSHAAGRALAEGLPRPGLRAVFVLADGISTNGSALIHGLRAVLPEDIIITGGLAGDGADFGTTFVGCDGPLRKHQAVAVGFYGDAVRVGWGSFGGWDRFGPERRVTRAEANVLYELDGEPALMLYKRYLGAQADMLPGSGLLFPLTVRPDADENAALVRTIVGIDDATHSMTFAGDIPEGWTAQLMRGNFDGLVEGAGNAAEAARARAGEGGESVSLLVSCIGRKLLMGQRIVDEVEAAAEILGPRSAITGFYSYGEIAPHGFTGRCELHNQTMTITTIGES